MTSIRALLAAVVVLLGAIQDASAWKLSMTHVEPIQVNEEGEATILCQADEPLVSCQFAVMGDDKNYPLIDLSRGNKSGIIAHKYPGGYWEVYNASYHCAGLEHGDCGVAFTDVWYVQFTVGCRGRTAKGGWKYVDMAVQASRIVGDTLLHMEMSPREVVALPGSSFAVLCTSKFALSICGIILPHRPRNGLVFGVPEVAYASTDYVYNGRGLKDGDCGIQANNVTERDNGPLWCTGLSVERGSTGRIVNIIVAKPPESVQLSSLSGTSHKVGDTLTALCNVTGGRPAGNITWYLGGADVSEYAVDISSADDEWRWAWDEQSQTQQLKMVLKREHVGRRLKCKVAHLALTSDLEKELRVSSGGDGTKGGTKGR